MMIFMKTTINKEIWKPVTIKRFEDRYEVSSLGRIRSLYYNKNFQDIPLIRKTFVNNSGYECITLKREGIKKAITIHSMVLFSFIGPRNNLECDHINNIKTDNRLVNLRWVAKKENLSKRILPYGENHNNSKYSDQQIEEIRSLYKKGMRQCDLVIKFKLSPSQVHRIIFYKRRRK